MSHSQKAEPHMVYDFHDHGHEYGAHSHHPDNGGHRSHEGVELVPSGWTPPTISRPLVVGLTGFAGSGKDTVGAEFIRRGWVRVSFAEPLKQLSLAIDPIVTHDRDGPVRLADLVNAFGWEHTKWNYAEARQFLQRLGNEARNIVGSNVWITIAKTYIDNAVEVGHNVVLTDVRYPNEADMIRSLDNGFVVKVDRPGVGPVNSHVSDRGLSETYLDAVLPNDGPLDEIPAQVDALLDALR